MRDRPELLDRIRADPRVYLSPGRTSDLRDIAFELATDAIYLGAADVTIERVGDWWLVASRLDWVLKDNKWSIDEAFFRLGMFQAYRQNANRANVLVTAFAHDVATFLNADSLVVQGCSGGLSEIAPRVLEAFHLHRVVAFKGPWSQA